MTTKDYNDCVKHYSDDLYRFALRYTGISEDSEDAVQDAFVVLWEKRDNVEKKEAKGYLIRTLYHKLVDRHRQENIARKAQERLMPKQENYNQHGDFELRDAMQQALDQLPDIQRQLVLLKDLEGYNYEEMSSITGLNEQQVGVYLFRARKTMKKLLEEFR